MIKYAVASACRKAKMASVTIRGNIIWLRGTVDGVRQQISTKKQATKANLDWVNRNKEKLLIELSGAPKQSELFNEYANYVLEVTKARRNTNSEKDARSKMNTINEYFGKARLDSIRPSQIEAWQSMMLQTHSPKTVLNFRGVLSMVFRYAEADGLIQKNPMTIIQAPKKPSYVPNTYSLTDIKALLSVSTGQFRDALQFNFFAGLRSGELIALKWSKVNFETNTIKIDERINNGETALPKGGKIRIVSMTPQAREALISQRMRTGLREYVFCNESGNAYFNASYFDVHFKKACVDAGLVVGKLYNTRHSFATLMLECGMNETWLIQQMGHFSIKVTREHYLGQLNCNFDTLKKIAL
jgi:integrase